jgi:hypothetical protein
VATQEAEDHQKEIGGVVTEGEDVLRLRASVRELVLAFRDGSVGFRPVAERSETSWRDENQHRDWEFVAPAMFDACVRSPIGMDADRLHDEFRLPRYDIDYDSYAELSWISVRSPARDGSLVFNRFTSEQGPFDTVQAAVVDPVMLHARERVEPATPSVSCTRRSSRNKRT